MFAQRVLAVFAAVAATVMAQDDAVATAGPPRPTPTDDDTPGPATVTIAVGAVGHKFTPDEVTAKVGDIIKFNFYPGAHRVARAEFGWPCIPYEYANVNKAGFYTGVFEPQVVSNDPPSYTVRVNNTEPIFFYCASPGSCIDYHMIGVINANRTQTLALQLDFASNMTYQLAPGEPFPTETPIPRPTPGSGRPNLDDGDGEDGGGGGGGLSGGAIAGIAIGATAVLVLGAALVYLCGRRGGFDKAYRKSVPAAAVGGVGGGGVGGVGGGGLGGEMVEAKYANASAAAVGGPKSPGLASAYEEGTWRGSVASGAGGAPLYGGHYNGAGGVSPYMPTTSPSPGPGGNGVPPGYHHGFVPGHGQGYGGHERDGIYPSPHSSPRADQYTPFIQAPVELPTGDAPVPTQSPPPGYQGRDSWAPGQEGQYRPQAKS